MVLVTGADGFIGRQVCSLLSRQGYPVVALDRCFDVPRSYPQLSGDIVSADFLAQAMQTGPVDTIVHLAAVLNTASRRRPEEALRVNIGSSLTLLELAVRSKVRKLIFASSIRVERLADSLYNTPAENWTASELAEHVHALNANVEVTHGRSPERGDPEAISGKRLLDELGYRPVPLRERLRQAAADEGS